MGAKESKRSENPQLQLSEAQEKRLLKAKREEYVRNRLKDAKKSIAELADTVAALRKSQNEIITTAKRELQEEASKLEAEVKLQEEASKRKVQEEAAKKKLEEETAAEKKYLEEAFQRKVVARRKQQEEALQRKVEEDRAQRKLLEEAAKRTLQEGAAKRTLQEEAANKELNKEVLKRKVEEEVTAKKKILEENFQRKIAARRKLQEEAFQRKLEDCQFQAQRKHREEVAKKKLQEEAAKTTFDEEVSKKIQEQPVTRSLNLLGKDGVLRYCHTCYKKSTMEMFKCANEHGSCTDCKSSRRNCGVCIWKPISNQRSCNNKFDLSPQTKLPCPHVSEGCKLNIRLADMEGHVEECPFQNHDCPLGTVFKKCSWQGGLIDLTSHFEDMHPNFLATEASSELQINNIHRNCHYIKLIGKVDHFVFHLKISETDKKVYMTVQLIGGTKQRAVKWLYEIHVYNKSIKRRKYMYANNCCSTFDNIEDIFKKGDCVVLPLEYASTFVDNKALTLKYFIKIDFDENRRDFGRN